MDKQDYEYLKSAQLDPCKPQFSEDVMFSVAHILISENVLKTTWDVLEYCQAPHKWIEDVKKLLNKYKESNNGK